MQAVAEIEGDTLVIYKPGPVSTVISWTVVATDANGNETSATYSSKVLPSPNAKGKASGN